MRQTRQIQREIDHQVGLIDKLNTRRQQDLQKKHTPTTTSRFSSSNQNPNVEYHYSSTKLFVIIVVIIIIGIFVIGH